ncbi:MAG: hypothetical protein QME93_05390 [Bacillota bacterium]|nr:hypothetical protein [Bacillota bacterium]MDI7249487.1 hypothetical protein [Bacillota bacterium]
MGNGDAVELKQKCLFTNVRTYYSQPLVLAEGRGVRVRDAAGRDYLDAGSDPDRPQPSAGAAAFRLRDGQE